MTITRQQRMLRMFDESHSRGLDVPTDFRYEHFFDYLKLSQSYWLAGRYRKGLIDDGNENLQPYFQEVLKIYDLFGDVTQRDFSQWWLETAQFKFGISSNPNGSLLMTLGVQEAFTPEKLEDARAALAKYLDGDRNHQGNRAVVVLALPIHANRVVMTYEFNRLLKASGLPLKEPRKIYPFSLLDNKLRTDMMDIAYRVALSRAANPKMQLMELGVLNRVVAPKTKAEEYDQRDVENITSRHLRRAFRLAENAAIGKFPSLEPVNAKRHQQFNSKLLEQQFEEYLQYANP